MLSIASSLIDTIETAFELIYDTLDLLDHPVFAVDPKKSLESILTFKTSKRTSSIRSQGYVDRRVRCAPYITPLENILA